MLTFECEGYCPICEKASTFRACHPNPELPAAEHPGWFRDGLLCEHCGSIPRERAITHALLQLRPHFRQLRIHEGSPSNRGLSAKLRQECADYTATQYDPNLPKGQMSPDQQYQSEDFEHQTFGDAVFDIVVTLDVFEHLFEPGQAAREIFRTLKPGGLFIMTVPLISPWSGNSRRAGLVDGQVVHFAQPEFHGNPVDPEGGSLVTVDWGIEIGAYLTRQTGYGMSVLFLDDLRLGVRDPYNAVVVGIKRDPQPVL